MKIRFADAEGSVKELEIATDYEKNRVVEVSTEIGTFYLESYKSDKSNQMRNSRSNRHISLERIEGYLFRDGAGQAVLVNNRPDQPKYALYPEAGLESQLIHDESVAQLLSCLNERQRFLVSKSILENRSYTDLAELEGRDESAVRHAIKRALKKLKNNKNNLG